MHAQAGSRFLQSCSIWYWQGTVRLVKYLQPRTLAHLRSAGCAAGMQEQGHVFLLGTVQLSRPFLHLETLAFRCYFHCRKGKCACAPGVDTQKYFRRFYGERGVLIWGTWVLQQRGGSLPPEEVILRMAMGMCRSVAAFSAVELPSDGTSKSLDLASSMKNLNSSYVALQALLWTDAAASCRMVP